MAGQEPVTAAPRPGPWKRRQLRVLGWLAGFWLVSDLGYYFGLPTGYRHRLQCKPDARGHLLLLLVRPCSPLAALQPLERQRPVPDPEKPHPCSRDLDRDLRHGPDLPALGAARACRGPPGLPNWESRLTS